MPLTDRSQAKESGFAQVREALQKFEGTVASAEWGQWGGKLFDDDGKPIPPKEFLEIVNVDVQVLEVTEELSMPIDEWTFRVNCSEFNGSFWVDKFLEATDKFKLLVPEDLISKRIVWEKATMTFNIKGKEVTQSNFIIVGVKSQVVTKPAPAVVPKATIAPQPDTEGEAVVAEEAPVANDPMEAACNLAIGKTEAMFRSAISLDPAFQGSPLVPLGKAGAITQALVNEGRLVLVQEGNKQVYKRPE